MAAEKKKPTRRKPVKKGESAPSSETMGRPAGSETVSRAATSAPASKAAATTPKASVSASGGAPKSPAASVAPTASDSVAASPSRPDVPSDPSGSNPKAQSAPKPKAQAAPKRETQGQSNPNLQGAPKPEAGGASTAAPAAPNATSASRQPGKLRGGQGANRSAGASPTPKVSTKRKLSVGQWFYRHWLKLVLGIVILAIVVSGCTLAWLRWWGVNDAQDIQGTWIDATGQATITITADEIILTDSVAYDYTIDPETKQLHFTFGNLEGDAHYRFSLDRQSLAIFDGSMDWWESLSADVPWLVGAVTSSWGGTVLEPAVSEEGVLLLMRPEAYASLVAAEQPEALPQGAVDAAEAGTSVGESGDMDDGAGAEDPTQAGVDAGAEGADSGSDSASEGATQDPEAGALNETFGSDPGANAVGASDDE